MRSLSCGIRLYGNQIGDKGATAIAEALKVNGALTVLGLENNKIGPSGATAIAEALKVNGALTELSLGGNRIGDQGATAIADALNFNGALKLKQLFVGSSLSGHALLKAACKETCVRLGP